MVPPECLSSYLAGVISWINEATVGVNVFVSLMLLSFL